MSIRATVFAAPLFLVVAAAQTQVPVTGLCNTGLTKASAEPQGCLTSTLVTPVNPDSGGPSVDGNWYLATPYPSAYNAPPPNPCQLPTYGSAWVDAAWSAWYNPDDGRSQYISPEVLGPYAGAGWFIYATTLPIPPAPAGSTGYTLTVTGQALVDNNLAGIVLQDPLGSTANCGGVVPPTSAGYSTWTPFTFSAPVIPNTHAALYFVTYNQPCNGCENPTALRVEFTSAWFTPK